MADLYLGHYSAVGAQILVFRESDAVTSPLSWLPAAPFGAPCRCVYDRTTARIFEMPPAEGDRVYSCCLSELVHEGFDRKHVGVRTQRAQCRGSHRHLAYVVVDDALVRKIVYRNRIAVRRPRGERHVDRRGPFIRPRPLPPCPHRRITPSPPPPP